LNLLTAQFLLGHLAHADKILDGGLVGYLLYNLYGIELEYVCV